MTQHSIPRRLLGMFFVLLFVEGLYQYVWGVWLP